jgi:glucose/arabinose dehydrogenase
LAIKTIEISSHSPIFPLLPFIILVTFAASGYYLINVEAQPQDLPNITPPDLRLEQVVKGLNFPTSMAFLGPNDILVLEKNNGAVQRIINGNVLTKPLLHVNVVNTTYEEGLLGLAVSKHQNNTPAFVFLYLTQYAKKDVNNKCQTPDYCELPPLQNESKRDRIYRYELVDNKLVNGKLLLDLLAAPGPGHNGGAITIGPDNNIYVPVGDMQGFYNKSSSTKAQNYENGTNPDGRAGILRISQDGRPVPGGNILGNEYPLNLYYAYGIRNSFGIDFDPVTKKLWDTENGPEYGDEINLVDLGFNSGWIKVQGIWKPKVSPNPQLDFVAGSVLPQSLQKSSLVNFRGKGKYSPPEFIWYQEVAPTALKFLNSDKLGKQYTNDLFVGDNNGYLYHFDLNKKRTKLSLKGPLKDTIANNQSELKSAIFGKGFGVITDLQVGVDKYLYILSSKGMIYRVVPDWSIFHKD